MAKAKSKAYRAGPKVRRQWLGKEYVDQAFRGADDFTIDLQHCVTERAALRNGISKAEIKEIFIQVATYAGAPAAVDSFRIAKRILAEKR